MRLFPTELTCLWVPPTSHSQQQSVLQDLTSSCKHLLSRQPLSTASIALISHCRESLGCFTNTLPCSALHTHPCWHQLSSKTQEDKTFLYGFCPYYRRGHCQGSWVSGPLPHSPSAINLGQINPGGSLLLVVISGTSEFHQGLMLGLLYKWAVNRISSHRKFTFTALPVPDTQQSKLYIADAEVMFGERGDNECGYLP